MRIEAWASRETGHGGRSKRAGFDHSADGGASRPVCLRMAPGPAPCHRTSRCTMQMRL